MVSPSSISFGMYTNDEILSISSVEVTATITFDAFSQPRNSGLYDERMGPIKQDGTCRTCRLGYFECPGHLGHIKLPMIVVNPMHMNMVYKKVIATCERCFAAAAKKCTKCNYRMPKFSRAQGRVLRNGVLVMPGKMRDVLRAACIDAEAYFLDAVPVIPNRFRPVHYFEGKVFEDSQNVLLARIVACAHAVRKEAAYDTDRAVALPEATPVTPKAARGGRRRDMQDPNRVIEDLIESVASYYDSAHSTYTRGKAPNGVKQILEKKEGLFRKHIMGKRVNYAARSVISPDPHLETREIGVPLIFAKKLTFPEPVTPFNHDKLKKAVQNGSTYPGATLIDCGGVITNLQCVPEEKRIMFANQLLIGKKIVYRHLNNTDYILVNRQPTLHKPSIMAYKVRILQGEKTIRLHYANCNSHNADFDGDEMNLHAPQCYLSKSEAKFLALNDYNYKVPTSGNPIRGLVQDHVVMGAVLTMKDYFLRPGEYGDLLLIPMLTSKILIGGQALGKRASGQASGSGSIRPAILRPVRLYTGKQVISALLLSLGLDVSVTKASRLKLRGHPEEEDVIIQRGMMHTGVLDKNNLGPTEKSLVHVCGEVFGESVYNDLLTAIGQVINKMLVTDAYTLRMDDLLLTRDGEERRRRVVDKSRAVANNMIAEYMADESTDVSGGERARGGLAYHQDKAKVSYLDNLVKNTMSAVTSEIVRLSVVDGMLKKFPYNNIELIVLTGAKGSLLNLAQISGLLGQQELEGKRVPLMVDGRSLPVLAHTTVESGGFIFERFLEGIRPHSYYFHCMAGREGLIDTAVKTSRSGYLQRCLIKHMEAVKVEYDGTVRNCGAVVSFVYGEDGLDCTKAGLLNEDSFFVNNRERLMQTYLRECVPEDRQSNVAQHEGSAAQDIEVLRKWKGDLAAVHPGEAVGIVAAQSIGEPSTQMTLNTFHLAGVGSKNVTLGIPRLIEILMRASKNIRTPYISLPASDISARFKKVMLSDCLSRLMVRESWLIRGESKYKKLSVDLTVEKEFERAKSRIEEFFVYSLSKRIRKMSKDESPIMEVEKIVEGVDVTNAGSEDSETQEPEDACGGRDNGDDTPESGDENSEAPDLADARSKKRRKSVIDTKYSVSGNVVTVELVFNKEMDLILYPLIEKTVSEIVVRETKGVRGASWAGGILTLSGANFDILDHLVELDLCRSYTNDIHSTNDHLGIEAARTVIIKEVRIVFDAYGINVNSRHLALIGDYMTRAGSILPFSRNGFTPKDSVLQKMSFESCYSWLRSSVQERKRDVLANPSACQTLGIPVKCGTGMFSLMYDVGQ